MDSSATPSCRVKSLADPSSMRIDESQLNDPDSLWRRKTFTKLSCGFINELGRFEAEIEPHPYHRQPSSGLQKIRRLMGREEDKVKEDMAYQVAEMIIKGVTQVTLGPQGKGMSLPPPPPPSWCTATSPTPAVLQGEAGRCVCIGWWIVACLVDAKLCTVMLVFILKILYIACMMMNPQYAALVLLSSRFWMIFNFEILVQYHCTGSCWVCGFHEVSRSSQDW